MTRPTFIAALLCLGGPAAADVSLSAAQSCFIAKTDATTCIDTAQTDCMASLQTAPAAATLCYTQARTVWEQGLTDRIAAIATQPDDTLTAVARIETRFDLLANMLQCDKIEALSKAASDLTGPEIAAQKAACQSTATGLSYMRLYMRSRTMGLPAAN